MHPNNKNKRKIQADINVKQPRNPVDVKMDLSALPTPGAFKQMPELSRIGFYMMVWMAYKELQFAPDNLNEDYKERLKVFLGWMQLVEETLPIWFATRYLR